MHAASRSLPILVVVHEEEETQVTAEPEDQLQEEGVREFKAAVRRVIRRRISAESVDIGRLAGDLDRVQHEVDQLLDGRTDHKVGGFRLKEVEVGLGLSAEGSIGVVTAGIEASISLIYSAE